MASLVENLVRQKYGYPIEDSDESLRNVINHARSTQISNNFARAGSQIGAAISGIKPNTSVLDSIDQQAQSRVGDIMMDRKAKADDLNFQNAQINNQQLQAQHDPNSPESQVMRKAYEKAIPGLAQTYGDTWNQVSAADKDLIFKPLEMKERIDARHEDMQMRYGQQEEQRSDTARTDFANKISDSKKRGSVSRAWDLEQSAMKAEGLLKQYPDLSKMPQAQYRLLVKETAKMAQGGSPTESGEAALMSDTWTGGLQHLYSKISNEPEPAKAGDFIRELVPYISELKDTSRYAIGQEIDTQLWGHKNKLSPADYADAQNKYKDYLDAYNSRNSGTMANPTGQQSPSQPAIQGPTKPGPGTIIRVKGKTYKVGPDGDSLAEVASI